MGNKKTKVQDGPAQGEWEVRPAEYLRTPKRLVYRTFRYFGWVPLLIILVLVCTFLLAPDTYPNFLTETFDSSATFRRIAISLALVLLIIFTLIAIKVVLNTTKPIGVREHDKFGIVISLNAQSGDGQRLLKSVIEWTGEGFQLAPNEDKETPLGADQAVVFENILPRLYSIQRSVDGVLGLLCISKLENGWRFSCCRNTALTIWYVLSLLLITGAAGIFFWSAFPILVEVGIAGSLILVCGVFVFARAFMMTFQKISMPDKLFLTVMNRDGSSELIDVKWTETHRSWFYVHIHTQWAAFSEALTFKTFCNRAHLMRENLDVQKATIKRKASNK